MPVYRIDRNRLDDFISRQVDLVEATPVPDDVADLVATSSTDDGLSADELHAVWLGAGLATQVGLAILEEPERFLVLTAAAHATA